MFEWFKKKKKIVEFPACLKKVYCVYYEAGKRMVTVDIAKENYVKGSVICQSCGECKDYIGEDK